MSKTLKNKAEKFIDLSLDLFAIASEDGYFTHISSGWKNTLGWTEKELKAKPFLEFVHEEDRNATRRAYGKLLNGEKIVGFVNRYICKNGDFRYISWRSSIDPTTKEVYALATDVTTEEQLKHFLRESQKLADVGHWSVDTNSNQCQWSDVTYAIHEEDPNKVILVEDGLSYYIPEHRPIIEQAVQDGIASGKEWDLELQIRTAKGNIKWVRAIGRAVIVNNKIIRLDGIFQDINEKKLKDLEIEKAFELAQQNERALKEAQIIAKIGSWQFDVRNQTITWSDQMFNIFGEDKSKGEPSYERHSASIHKEDFALWSKTVQKCLKDGLPYTMKFRTVHKDGTIVWIEAYGRGIKNNIDEVIALSGTCQDISDKVNSEINLERERGKVIQASKLSTLGEMAGGIAHEINNPLTIISGQIYRFTKLADKQASIDSNKVVELTNKMFVAVNRIKKTVNSLLNFAREGGVDDLQVLDIEELFENSLSFCKTRFLNYGIYIDLEIDDNFSVECNDVQMSQVFLNLLNNSFNSLMELSKEFNLDKRITISAKNEADYAVIDFMDNGIGIDPEIVDKIYDPFFTTAGVGEGSGLGLSVAKGIVEAHGGKIELLSNREPTVFRIKLPLRIQASAAA